MTSEGTDLALTSKTGKSVAHYRHRVFLLRFFCLTEDIFRHFIGLNSLIDSDLKGSRDGV